MACLTHQPLVRHTNPRRTVEAIHTCETECPKVEQSTSIWIVQCSAVKSQGFGTLGELQTLHAQRKPHASQYLAATRCGIRMVTDQIRREIRNITKMGTIGNTRTTDACAMGVTNGWWRRLGRLVVELIPLRTSRCSKSDAFCCVAVSELIIRICNILCTLCTVVPTAAAA